MIKYTSITKLLIYYHMYIYMNIISNILVWGRSPNNIIRLNI